MAYIFLLFRYSENDLPVPETDHLAVISFFLAKKTKKKPKTHKQAVRVQELAVIKDQYLFKKLIAKKKEDVMPCLEYNLNSLNSRVCGVIDFSAPRRVQPFFGGTARPGCARDGG